MDFPVCSDASGKYSRYQALMSFILGVGEVMWLSMRQKAEVQYLHVVQVYTRLKQFKKKRL